MIHLPNWMAQQYYSRLGKEMDTVEGGVTTRIEIGG